MVISLLGAKHPDTTIQSLPIVTGISISVKKALLVKVINGITYKQPYEQVHLCHNTTLSEIHTSTSYPYTGLPKSHPERCTALPYTKSTV